MEAFATGLRLGGVVFAETTAFVEPEQPLAGLVATTVYSPPAETVALAVFAPLVIAPPPLVVQAKVALATAGFRVAFKVAVGTAQVIVVALPTDTTGAVVFAATVVVALAVQPLAVFVTTRV